MCARMCSLEMCSLQCNELSYLRLEVAVDARGVDGHLALVCLLEEGLSSDLEVGQRRDQYLVLVGVLRQV